MPLTSEQLDQLRQTSVGASGNRVQAALDLLRVTQTAAGEAIGLKTSYVSDVARGRMATVEVTTAYKFTEFFGCAIEDIFPRVETPASMGRAAMGTSSDELPFGRKAVSR